MSPEALAHVLRPLQELFKSDDYPDLLLGLDAPDDAAVYRLDDRRALVFTTDFFTPIVDDPYDYGAIAATNALSDVYAMGGRPLLALSLVALPSELPTTMVADMMRGMAETVYEAGTVIAGGHSIKDAEPKLGLCVAGFADPDRLMTKGRACAGDILALTKPLGTGVITTAAKRDRADPDDLAEAVRWMKRLNRRAAEIALELGVHCGTDVTGFGLLGHAWEIAQASRAVLYIDLDSVPFLSGARRYGDDDLFSGGTRANLSAYGQHIHFDNRIRESDRLLLSDAQTSGGLLLAIPPSLLSRFREEMARAGKSWWQIGQVEAGETMIWVQ